MIVLYSKWAILERKSIISFANSLSLIAENISNAFMPTKKKKELNARIYERISLEEAAQLYVKDLIRIHNKNKITTELFYMADFVDCSNIEGNNFDIHFEFQNKTKIGNFKFSKLKSKRHYHDAILKSLKENELIQVEERKEDFLTNNPFCRGYRKTILVRFDFVDKKEMQ